jgi:Overcoming lysogenization defect protein-like, TOPRIM domain
VDEESLAAVAWLGAVTEAAGGSRATLAAAVARARDDPGSVAVVLVEGMSDQAALETLAARRGRDLRGEGVFVVPMGGATNIGHFLGLFGPRGFGVRLAGLCDQGEERDFRRGLERAGLLAPTGRLGPAGLLTPAGRHDLTGRLDHTGHGAGPPEAGRAGPLDLAGLGFFVCVADLEDELIRALGVCRVERLIEAEGESRPFQTFTGQPAQRNRTREQQLRRFLGTRSGRKIRYGHVLAAALDLTRVPAPLAGVLSWV